MNTIQWDDLNRDDGGARQRLIKSLREFGFVRVRLPKTGVLDELKMGIDIGRHMTSFRFPPVNGDTIYTDEHRACFRALYSLSRQCLAWLIRGISARDSDVHNAILRLDASYDVSEKLFGEAGQSNTPFTHERAPFANSFFNIFHYDYGLLNAHKDRYLITAIYADANPSTATNRSVLWVRARNGSWTNVDALLEPDVMVFMVGEDLEHVLKNTDLELYAAEHCIRVDPDGERLERAHFRPDPSTSTQGNRLSVAFILGDERIGKR